MDISKFDYELSPELIAQEPCFPRDKSKLLSAIDNNFKDLSFSKLPELFSPGDVIVVNDTKVIKANLIGFKKEKKISFTLNKKLNKSQWLAYCKPSKKCNENDIIKFKNNLIAKINKKFLNGEVLLEFNYLGEALTEKISSVGNLPLPPYIKNTRQEDNEKNYQTFFAKNEGAIAAPTAGLHFTKFILEKLKKKNIFVVPITLHVGSGTFLPVKTSNIEDHKMHYESYEISQKTSDIINQAINDNKKIISIGTTVTRTLECVAKENGKIIPKKGSTNLFIKPGFDFKIVDYLLTNFHLPKSTLLILISSFFGYENVFKLYKHAIKNNYRFYSYGDCCLLPRKSFDGKI